MTYRKSNIWTRQQFINCIQHKSITVRPLEKGDMKDFDALWKGFYKKFDSGSISKNQIFTATEEQPGEVNMCTDNLPETVKTIQKMAKRRRGSSVVGEDRKFALREGLHNLQSIDGKGIPDIKWIECFFKWRSLIPGDILEIEDARGDSWFRKPPETMIEAHKQTRNEKARVRTMKKRKMMKGEVKGDIPTALSESSGPL